jgi:hypothetical protein
MQLFVKIFQAVGMAMNNAFTKKDELPQNEYFDFTAKLFTWRKTKNSYSYWNDALHSENNVYLF